MEFVRSFPDTDGDGIPEIPARYAGSEGRIVRAPSLSPVALLARASYVTWAAVGAVVLVLVVLAGVALLIVVLVRRRRSRHRPSPAG
jgi:5'-nucleotidase